MFEKAGQIAGAIWNALNETEGLSAKDLKKATKIKTEKDLYLGLGWLLREDKLNVDGDEKDPVFALKK
ncbi:MAG: winged helix-turn-helix domain-containing protein [Clostridium sp.]|nr:winged helix-turn-helix domain-containing protein [Clostridium sp.]